jgi:two-component system, NarL family, sensor histidine kinase BarA
MLFGIATVVVIAAAIFLPWYRVEQLTGQLNERAAEAVIQTAVDQHRAYWTRRMPAAGAVTRPVDSSAGPAEIPARPVAADLDTAPASGPPAATRPASQPGAETPAQYGPAKLLLLKRFDDRATAIERRSMLHFQRHPGEDPYTKLSEVDDDRYVFRYGRVLDMDDRCIRCHSDDMPTATPLQARAFAMATVEIPSQVDPNDQLKNRMFIFVAAAVAGIVAVSFFFIIIKRLILDNVRVLQQTAEKVSEGDLNIRTHIPSNDEFQVLSETFNKMLHNLKQSEDQLRALNKSLDLKLEEMAESNLALYESNRLKSEFLANVSHELRTPLNSILGFAELLKDATRPDAKVSRYVQNITSSGRSLLDLINDLLDLAKIEAGKMEVRSEPLSLSDLFEGLSNILRPLLEPRSLSIKTQISSDVPLMHTDAAKLQQILYNFLSNAIKYSPPGGEIELSARRQGEDRVRISVCDHGPGIAPEKQQVIFEKFRQIDGSHTRQHGGTGLGLAISRDLTQLLAGQIGVDSEPGQGATFWILLPIRIDPSTQDLHSGMVAGTTPAAG